MTYTILGRAIPKEYLSMGVLGSLAGFVAYKQTGKKNIPKSVEEAKKAVPINAGSSEEEQFIRKFIADAEKEGAAASKH
ncbi:hypothetical protein R3P38DRAFT_2875591 [Favolaschia claudopus]|uniref:ATP synthase subunit K, mitochondrial n=1 Tax=Favolaschia claudopus TaxID=2862362 RepID=A0AAW0D314_9AGAR